MLAGCRATLPLFSNSSLCPSFFLHSPPYIFIGNNVLEATRWFKVLGLNCTLVLELSLLKTSLKFFNVLYLSMSPPLKRLLFGNVDVRVLFCFVFCFFSWFARLLASSRSSGESWPPREGSPWLAGFRKEHSRHNQKSPGDSFQAWSEPLVLCRRHWNPDWNDERL